MTGRKDKLLFTPGPLTTSRTVKEAMLRDLGSRDDEFIAIVASVRERLLKLGGVSRERGYEAIPMQGSGTFGIEAALASAVGRGSRMLLLRNGAYGRRIEHIARRHGIEVLERALPENEPFSAADLAFYFKNEPTVDWVAAVHCETTTGVMNPVEEIGSVARDFGARFFVDAMSSFGGVPLDLERAGIDLLVSSSNKCVEGAPGFSFALVKRDCLIFEGYEGPVSLDLAAQLEGFEKNGQFRFTPPTHALLAFDRALNELEEEGGVDGRAERYRRNHETLVSGMRRMGFEEYVAPENQGWIITTFLYPEDPAFDFAEFYDRLSGEGMAIYPGKLTERDCFRIGNIGRLFEEDMRALLAAIERTLRAMGVAMPGADH